MPGQLAPPISLRSTSGQRVRSWDLVGQRLVLAFTGLAGDPLSDVVLARLRAVYPALVMMGAAVFAIAPVEADTGFLAEPGVPVPFPILRDVASEVHRRYGAVDWSGQPAASVIVTDRSKRIIYRALGGLGEALPSGQDVIAFLQFDHLSPAFLSGKG